MTISNDRLREIVADTTQPLAHQATQEERKAMAAELLSLRESVVLSLSSAESPSVIRAERDRLRAELDEATKLKMRAQTINSSMDCRFAGQWAEMSGSHCPAERPCDRCTAERELADRDARIEALVSQLQSEEDDHRRDVERLTKERDEWREAYARALATGPRVAAPHPGDEELRAELDEVGRIVRSEDGFVGWRMTRIYDIVKLLAKRALGEQ